MKVHSNLSEPHLEEMESRARAAFSFERSMWNDHWSGYVPAGDSEVQEESFVCPLCEGDGEIDGIRYDHKHLASTVMAYGIGTGLGLAEAWVKLGPQDVLDLVKEVRFLRRQLINDLK